MPKVSIVVLAHNHLHHTENCIESIKKYTSVDYELVLIDNGSEDGTTWNYFSYLQRKLQNIHIIHNEKNIGVPAGFNQGIEAATGDYICFLNNDTIITKGWLSNMMKWYSKKAPIDYIGLAAPRTNYAFSLQVIRDFPQLTTYEDIHSFSEKWCKDHKDTAFQCLRIIGMCMLIPKWIIEDIGLFDESFGLGNFEDDDYIYRLVNAGYETLVVNDSFVYHHGSVTCNDFDFTALLKENEKKFIKKYERTL